MLRNPTSPASWRHGRKDAVSSGTSPSLKAGERQQASREKELFHPQSFIFFGPLEMRHWEGQSVALHHQFICSFHPETPSQTDQNNVSEWTSCVPVSWHIKLPFTASLVLRCSDQQRPVWSSSKVLSTLTFRTCPASPHLGPLLAAPLKWIIRNPLRTQFPVWALPHVCYRNSYKPLSLILFLLEIYLYRKDTLRAKGDL